MGYPIVFLNGPPRSGKDTLGASLRVCLGFELRWFATPMKHATHVAYGLDCAVDAFEAVKDQPREEFYGLTPRRAYIEHSENYMKRLHGDRVYGDILARKIEGPTVIADSGFEPECSAVAEKFGPENCLVVKIQRDGCTFKNDSRSYVNIPGVKEVILQNNGPLIQSISELGRRVETTFNL